MVVGLDDFRGSKPNRLASERSVYLRRHAYNPVDWYPWGDEAFRKAKKEDKPVFLSVGYSTCHWCHVMERESFQDPEVAKMLNEAFVCVKVDREERPDIDAVYMKVCQAMTGVGGWPLTVIMTPDKKPFFAATYIPRESRFGIMGLRELVPRILEAWRNRRREVEEAADVATSMLSVKLHAGEAPGDDALHRAYEALSSFFDERVGGFGYAPKFPEPHRLCFLLRYWKRTGEGRALSMVEKTLRWMRLGGIYDHVGFGFHRYSTDSRWRFPHFEKMLYDQAMITIAYLETFQVTGEDFYARTAREVLSYVLRTLKSPKNIFYSAEDAESGGEEGGFYLWSEEEVREALHGEDADLVMKMFNVTREGNFTGPLGERTGKNVLYFSKPIPALAAEAGLPVEELEEIIEKSRLKLFRFRERRAHPEKDTKALTDWNGLMIAALSKAFQVLGDNEYLQAARETADFILDKARGSGGELCHVYFEDGPSVRGFLDDYAFLAWGLLELYEACFEEKYLEEAVTLMDEALRLFWDSETGGFHLAASDAEHVLVNVKEGHDGPYPSGNSVAMMNLLRLSHMTGRVDYEERAEEVIKAFSRDIKNRPESYTHMLSALDFALGPTYEVVVAGPRRSEDTERKLKALQKPFIPRKVVLFHSSEEPSIERLAPFTSGMKEIDGESAIYVCFGHACQRPTKSLDEALRALGAYEKRD
ncbi:MAG: thioredoxin domain-containing protein [Candidatus Jordarchaeales archaeon]